jgi:hypothetical protein
VVSPTPHCLSVILGAVSSAGSIQTKNEATPELNRTREYGDHADTLKASLRVISVVIMAAPGCHTTEGR